MRDQTIGRARRRRFFLLADIISDHRLRHSQGAGLLNSRRCLVPFMCGMQLRTRQFLVSHLECEVRVLSPYRKHPDLRLTSVAVGSLPQVGEVVENKHGRSLSSLSSPSGMFLFKQILSTRITRLEHIVVPEKQDVISNQATMTIVVSVDLKGTITVSNAAALVVFHNST